MKKSIALMILMALFVSVAFAAITDYVFTEGVDAYTPLATYTVSTAGGDDGTQLLTLPFTFVYDGTPFTTLGVCMNGFAKLGGTSSAWGNDISSTGNTNFLCPLWDDLYYTTGVTQIRYSTLGTQPNRVFVVEWYNSLWYYTSGTPQFLQLYLYETSNNIKFSYNLQAPGGTASASIGLTDFVGGSGHYLSVTPGNPSTLSSTVANNSIGNITYLPVGKWYHFAPPAIVNPPGSATLVYPAADATGIPRNAALSWTLGGGGPEGVKVYLDTVSDPVAYTEVGVVTSWDPPGLLAPNQDYWWKVVPWNTNGAAPATVQHFQTGSGYTYAASGATSTADTDIGQVVLGTFANPLAYPSTIINNPLATGTYTDYTALGPIVLLEGSTNPFSLTQITTGSSFYGAWGKVYIDLNQDGVLDPVTEQLFSAGSTTVATPTLSGNITIPVGTPYGQTRMRVVLRESGSEATTLPTGTYSWGETEDYTVSITSPIAGAPAAPILSYPGEHASGINPFTVHFNWSPDLVNGSLPDGYHLYLVATGDLPNPWNSDDFFGAATLYENVSNGFAPAFAFAYNTNYTWTVEAYAAGYPNAHTWPPYDFTTMLDPSITTFPYVQDFEIWPPANWDLTGGTYSFTQYLDGSGNNWAEAGFWGQTAGNTDVMTTPPILTNDPVQLSFTWSHQYMDTYPGEALTIQISDDLATWNNLWYKTDADLESADGAGSVNPGTGVLATVPIPSSYLGSPFWIRFYGLSGYGPDLFIDDVTIGVPLAHDVGVVSIDINAVIGSAPITPMATVMNYGMNTETFNVQMNIGTGYTQTVTVNSLASGMSEQVSFPQFTPVVGTVYGVQTQTLLPTDENPANDVMYSTTASLDLDYQAFADVAYAGGGTTGPATFNLLNPGSITDLPAANPWETRFLSGADWINGEWWGSEYYDATNLVGGIWWQIDTTTGAATNMGGDTTVITGVAFDPMSGTIYGSSSTDLYTINPLNGSKTMVGSFGVAGSVMISIAYNNMTNILYGVDLVTDALYTINTSTGAATLIGPLGININYAQDMAFNQNNGTLYLAGYTTTGSLYWVDTNTGVANLLAPFQGGWEIDGFVIPYGGLQAPDVMIAADGTLTWGAIAGATGYKIYSSDDPYGTFTYLNSTTGTSWLDPAYPQAKRFYQVTADDTVIRGPLQIRYEGDVYRNVKTVRSTEPQTYRRYTPPVK